MKKSDTIQKVYPLTPMQEGMLFHSIMDPDSSAYHNLLQAKIMRAARCQPFRTKL